MKLSLFLILIILLSTSYCFRDKKISEVDKLIKIHKLSDRLIIVGLASDAITAINTRVGIVVVDAGISYSLTGKYRALIEKEFGTNNFIYLIQTHAHHDHTSGNLVFKDAVIVGHKNCIDDLALRNQNHNILKERLLRTIKDYSEKLSAMDTTSKDWNRTYCQKLRYQFAYNDLVSGNNGTRIDSTFTDQLSLKVGDLTFNLYYFGKAHSSSDIVIHIPRLKLLMTGDLFTSYGKPSINDEKIDDRCEIIAQILEDKKDSIETIISGHGQILTKEDFLLFTKQIKNWNEN